MYITFKPGDGDKQAWEFDPEGIKASQAEMIEKRYGSKGFAEWLNAVRTGNIRARRVLLWHLISRTHALKWEDTPDFALRELLVEQSHSELLDLRAQLDKMPLEDDERTMAYAMVEKDLAEARIREGLDEDGEPLPKAPSQ